MYRKLFLIVLASILVTACGETLRSSWGDFRAYYNTFYNARESFDDGLKKVSEQPRLLDPSEPVRVHPAPVAAAGPEFEQATEKGQQVVQRFPESKWMDDALLLVGQSFYYRQEYYSALQKFEELLHQTSSMDMAERAIIWKGRTLIDLGLYREGVTFLEGEIRRLSGKGRKHQLAEMQVLAAEHYALLEEWEPAAEWLSQSIPGIEKEGLSGRTFFLYGQMLERLGRLGEAYYAYSQVPRHFTGYEYNYWAGYKQAEVARKEGNLNLALTLYENLRKDDKYLDQRERLTFEMMQTLEQKGDIRQAIQGYHKLLENRDHRLRGLRGDIYYRLGVLYGDTLKNYEMAAAYFDSSSAIAQEPSGEGLPHSRSLAEAYTQYAQLQQQLVRTDSLLWLGSLTKTQQDSVLKQAHLQRKRQLLAEEERRRDHLVNIQTDSVQSTTTSTLYGFLNHRNGEMVRQMREEFRVVWGSRPLIDNWRQEEVVQRRISRNEIKSPALQQPTSSVLSQSTDREEIPSTAQEKTMLKRQQVGLYYELGNLLLFTLDMPGEAQGYFHRVLGHDLSQSELQVKAMYSLYELFKAQHQEDSLQYWEHKILDRFPNTVYARSVKETGSLGRTSEGAFFGGSVATEKEGKTGKEELKEKFQHILAAPDLYKGARLRALAKANINADLAPYIYYQAIEAYIRQAKADLELSSFPMAAVLGVQATLSDSAVSTEPMALLVNFKPLGRESGEYFKHAAWDSVRLVLKEYQDFFPEESQRTKLAGIQEALLR